MQAYLDDEKCQKAILCDFPDSFGQWYKCVSDTGLKEGVDKIYMAEKKNIYRALNLKD